VAHVEICGRETNNDFQVILDVWKLSKGISPIQLLQHVVSLIGIKREGDE